MFCRIALAWLSNNCLFHHRLIISSCLPAKKRILLRVDIKTHSRVSRPPFTQKKNLCGSFKHFLCVGPGKISNLTNMFQMPFLPGGEPPTSCNRNGYGDACWQWSFPLSFFFWIRKSWMMLDISMLATFNEIFPQWAMTHQRFLFCFPILKVSSWFLCFNWSAPNNERWTWNYIAFLKK